MFAYLWLIQSFDGMHEHIFLQKYKLHYFLLSIYLANLAVKLFNYCDIFSRNIDRPPRMVIIFSKLRSRKKKTVVNMAPKMLIIHSAQSINFVDYANRAHNLTYASFNQSHPFSSNNKIKYLYTWICVQYIYNT